jgi:hypothetical protein
MEKMIEISPMTDSWLDHGVRNMNKSIRSLALDILEIEGGENLTWRVMTDREYLPWKKEQKEYKCILMTGCEVNEKKHLFAVAVEEKNNFKKSYHLTKLIPVRTYR